MEQRTFDKFFEKNSNKEELQTFLDDCNEYDDEHVDIAISIIDEEFEYGYGYDKNFVYKSIDQFLKNGKKDVLKNYKLDEIEDIAILALYYSDEDPEDISEVEIATVKW